MSQRDRPGLGELLRYVGELVERGADEAYRAMNSAHRARYTPILRALGDGAVTISDITRRSHLTQSAISQTVGLMVGDGLVVRHALEDARSSSLRLTSRGKALLQELVPHWSITFDAITTLEQEIGHPLLRALADAAKALERQGFAARLKAAGEHQAHQEAE
jgi:MarR family transcriptional regulator, organic hydroperoxide resistance regulator